MGSEEDFVVKVRGLPWSTTVEEIMTFFDNCNIKGDTAGVHIIMTREGRPSGEAFVEMETSDDIAEALKKDREYMGSRYMEVFKAKKIEMDWILMKSGTNLETSLDDGCVRLRGLPFGCSKEEIAHFFSGLEIVPNGITLPMDGKGRSTGEAFVQFKNKDIAEKALLKHKEKIAHRYIEIFRSSVGEICQSVRRGFSPFPQRPAPYDARDRFGGPNRFRPGGPNGRNFRGGFNDDEDDMDDGPWPPARNGGGGGVGGGGGGFGLRGMGNFGGLGGGMGPGCPGPRPNFGGGFGGGPGPFGGPGNFGGGGGGGGSGGGDVGPHCIHMRGLPFRASKQEVADFFRPVVPLSIDVLMDDKNRPSGEADVEFRTHEDAVMAMGKNKSHMDHRYIELFLNSTQGKGGSGFGGGGNFRSNFGSNMFKRF